GSYAIEVWVVDSTGTSIYPSDGSTGFTITNNIQSANGSVITTITFDDFVKELNKAASTIDKGDKGNDGLSAYQVAVNNGYHGSQTDWLASLKGDTGTVDNAGLTSAPAFQSLQTQVDNSAVVTNLATGTSSCWQKASFTGGWGTTYLSNQVYEIKDGETYTLQVETQNVTSPINLEPFYYTAAGARTGLLAPKKGADNDGKIIITFTANLPNDYAYFMPNLAFAQIGAGSYEFRRFKLEKGSVATGWSPNPSEILTQSDYAKIKAAIVALGGSLS
ncbi:hypothetical protein, partial [Lactiplantibacillus plantarum]